MKVLQLGPFPPPHGGVQTNLVAIRDCLRANGHACAVINITRHRRQDADEVYYPESALALVRLLARLDYDILHLHLGGDLTPRLLALCLVCCALSGKRPGKRPGKRTVLTFHSGGYPGSPGGLSARPFSLRGFALRGFDRLIAVNSQIGDLFLRFGVRPERVRVIEPHAMAPAIAAALPVPLASFFACHNPVLLSVGLLEPEYDLPLQIALLEDLRRRRPGAGLAMIGSGSLEKDLRSRIAASPSSSDILLTGDLPHPSTLRAIEQCSILLRTTHYDGDSISVREALHLGTPVIATDNGMRPEGVRLVPIGDPAALLRAIEACLAAGLPRTPRQQAGRENLEAVLGVYRDLV